MKLTTDNLASAHLKVERAKEHIHNLHSACAAFINSSPYKVSSQQHADTGKPVYRLAHAEPVPTVIAVLAGDAIHCLRSALDHIAYQLWKAGTGAGQERFVSFPISDSKKPAFSAEVQGMGAAAVAYFDALQAYDGGNCHQLWVLHRLDIIDKHRLLIPVGGKFGGFNAAQWSVPTFEKLDASIPREVLKSLASKLGLFITVGQIACPLKVGDELFLDTFQTEVNEDMQFRFQVALHEPGVIERKPILEAMQEFVQLVERIVADFTI